MNYKNEKFGYKRPTWGSLQRKKLSVSRLYQGQYSRYAVLL